MMLLDQVVSRAQFLARAVSREEDSLRTVDVTKDEAAVARRQIAALQGELEGATCKLDGFQRALQEMEVQLAHKDLNLAMLKAVIEDGDSNSLRRRVLQAREESQDLRRQLQAAEMKVVRARQDSEQLQLKVASSNPTCADQGAAMLHLHNDVGVVVSVTTAPHTRPSHAAKPASLDHHAAQLAILHKALAMANLRLRSLSAPPVVVQDAALYCPEMANMDPGPALTASRASSLSLPSDICLSPNMAHSPFSTFDAQHAAASSTPHASARTSLVLCPAGSAEGSVEGPATPPSPSKASGAPGATRALVLSAAGVHCTSPSLTGSGLSNSPASADRAAEQGQGSPLVITCSALELESPCGDGSGGFAGDAAYESEARQTTCLNPLFRNCAAPGHAYAVGTASGPCSPCESTDSALPKGFPCSKTSPTTTRSPAAAHMRSFSDAFPRSTRLLEARLLAAQQALAAVTVPAAAAQGEASAAYKRLRHSVKLLTQLYEQLKQLLEQAGQQEQIDGTGQVLQSRLAHAIEDLAKLAAHTRELGSNVNAVRRLVAQIEGAASGSCSRYLSREKSASTASAAGCDLSNDASGLSWYGNGSMSPV